MSDFSEKLDTDELYNYISEEKNSADSIINSLTTIIEAKNDSISSLKQQNDIETETKVEDSSSKWIVALLATFVFGFFTPFILKKIPQTAWLLTWYR